MRYNRKKTITVDHYTPFGTRGPMIADFWYRGELIYSILAAIRRDIDERLQTLSRTQEYTHWRSKQTGRTRLIHFGFETR